MRVVLGSSPPGADLWVAGYKRSRTPASVELEPGTYEVLMQQRGGGAESFTVVVVSGQGNSWCYDFVAKRVSGGTCPAIGPGSFAP